MSGQGGATSRDSVAGAGWHCPSRDLKGLLPPGRRNKPAFGWTHLKTIWEARNDFLAKKVSDPSAVQRELWLDDWYGRSRPDFRIDRTDLAEPSFVVLGDTGEGDASQYALLAVLQSAGSATDFMVVCSDVVYPAGEVEEYADKFFYPYRDYPAPIYALPGNHDWYDDLRGFMFQFCGRERQPRRRSGWLSKAGLRDLLWRDTRPVPDPARVARMRELRGRPEQQSRQPGPYHVIETGPLELVSIDVGVVGEIDRTQGEWLRRVSRSAKPKVLLTGRPIYVDGKYHPCQIDGGRGGTVDTFVRDPDCNYVAAIGGDIHNYQRYPVDVDGRTIQYLVSGGGGAFMHATHKIPNIDKTDLKGVSEASFRCYPLRGDSLSFYSGLWNEKFRGDWIIEPEQAAAYMAERLGIEPTKGEAKGVRLSDETRRKARRVFPLPGHAHGPWHAFFAEFFDWNDPPLFKHLLRFDTGADRITIRCHAATGCQEDDRLPPEDELVCRRQADGGWRWQSRYS
jgi:Calcineurin-like phosphoesterase